MIMIYTLIFSQVMKSRLGGEGGPFSYSLYLCSGLLAWNFFSEAVSRGVNALLDNATFMKKMSFPPLILFGAALASAGINFLIAMGIFSVALLFIHPVPIDLYLSFYVVVMLLAAFAFGISMGLGCLNVFLRDVQQLVNILFQLWFWFTPIVYLTSILPDIARKMLYFNPAWPFVESMHQLIFFRTYPPIEFWGMMVGWVVVSMITGLFLYSRLVKHVRDQL
jgi:lipopolysaccharide transport system permease protein